MVAVVYGLTGSGWSAEDLAQETFLRAHNDWTWVGGMAAPSAWVRRVALNLAVSRYRRFRSEAAAKLRLTPNVTSVQPPTAESQAFWEEVRRLPRRQSQVLALRYIDDLSVAEIAEVLQVAEGTVKALMHQARRPLGRQLVARSQDRTASDGSDIGLMAPPLPVLDRPVAVAPLDLLRRATAVEQSEPPVERDDEAVRS